LPLGKYFYRYIPIIRTGIGEGIAVLQAAALEGIGRASVHLILDDRSSPPQGAADILESLAAKAPSGVDVEAATAMGRGF